MRHIYIIKPIIAPATPTAKTVPAPLLIPVAPLPVFLKEASVTKLEFAVAVPVPSLMKVVPFSDPTVVV